MPIPTVVRRIRTPKRWRTRKVGGKGFRFPHFRRDWVRKTLIAAVACAFLGTLFLVALFAWVSRDLPDPNNITNRRIAESTKIYDRTGKTVLYDVHGPERRTVVDLDEIAENVKKATIVAEDKDFYRHHGFDLTGIFRAVFKNIVNLDPSGQGGSTITQQFIKNSILTSEKSYVRKVKEVILAYQLEKRFTKDEILKLYLNEIPYGSNAYGVEAASQLYFGKSAKDLTLAESAIVASIPKATTYYSPYGDHRDALVTRAHLILDGMASEGYVTHDEAAAAKTEEVRYALRRDSIIAPHFVFFVREMLAEKYGESVVEQGGLKVITTLDLDHQKAAEEAIAEQVQKNEEKYDASNAALTSLDTKTGQILAMVGSRDYFDLEHDGNVNVALRPRQPGSSFKPIVYTVAFEKGYTPETILFDLVTNFGAGGEAYTPHNYNNNENGPLTMRRALAGSLNIPAVKTLYLAGVTNVLDTADRLGYGTFGDRSRFGLSIVLGGAEVTLLDHVGAYATLAREGLRHPSTPILKVEDRNGKVLEEFKDRETRVLDEQAVRMTQSIMSDDGARSFVFGRGSKLTLPGRVVAAKTGTTNDFRDGWALGYTPSLAAGVWVGNNDNSAMVRGADGVVIAAPIWNSYMQKMLEGTPKESFKEPPKNDADKPVLKGEIDTVTQLSIDTVTRKIIPDECLASYPKEFVTTRDFKETHTILYYLQKNDPRGPAPADPADDPQFAAWEAPVKEWAKKHGYPERKKIGTERCNLRQGATAPSVSITVPAPGTTTATQDMAISIVTSGGSDIVKVDLFIDATLITTLSTPPFEATYHNTLFTNGAHTLKAVATDALGYSGEASVSLTYSLPSSTASIAVLSPQDRSTFRLNDLPLDVGVSAFDPEGFASIVLTDTDGAVLESKASPQNGRLTLTATSLTIGNHTLRVTATRNDGAVLSTSLTVAIQAAN